MPTEIDVLGRSCDVVRHGSLLKLAVIRCSLNVFTSRGSARIIANLTRENLAERRTEIANLPWTHTEKQCISQMQNWTTSLAYQKKTVLCLGAVTDEEGHPLENEDESGRRLCEYWRTIFQARRRPEASPI